MKEKSLNHLVVITSATIGIIFLSWWMIHDPVKDFEQFVPGLDNRPKTSTTIGSLINIGEFFQAFNDLPVTMEGSWPRFRGVNFDNISQEKIKLVNNWNDTAPNILWSLDLGEGHAGPVIAAGRVYVLDYDEENRREILRCFSFHDGKEIWRRGYDIFIKRNHGMSRTVPAVNDNYVVTIGPKCHVMCVDAKSGNFIWGIDLEREYQAEIPLWYTGQCALIDDSLAVIAVGGKSLIIAIHCETGRVVWQTPNSNNWKMSHSSIIPMQILGEKMYVYCALGGLIGISSSKENAGEILFQNFEWNQSVIAPSPVYLGAGKIFISAGYGAGSATVQVSKKNNTYEAKIIQRLKPDEGLASEQQTPVFYKGHLFAILPKDAGALRNQFVCCRADDCSKIKWSSGKTKRFGLGPYIIADNKFFILSDNGVLTIIKASTEDYVELAQIKILDGHDAWGPLAIANGRLLARDSRRLVCVDLRPHS
jgi:outer membrane protein assembly factor BamB